MKQFVVIYFAIVLAGLSLYGLFELKLWRANEEQKRIDAPLRAKAVERENAHVEEMLDEYTAMWADWKKGADTMRWNDDDEKLRRMRLAIKVRELIVHPLLGEVLKQRGAKLADEIEATARSRYSKTKPRD